MIISAEMIFRLLLLHGKGRVDALRLISAKTSQEGLSIARKMVKESKGRFSQFELWRGKHRILEPTKKKPRQ
jgi:hypothetical protein